MRAEIIALRKIMKEKGLDGWISPSSDAHQSEYVGEHDACRKYLSGFTGSAGTLVVLTDSAYLWTDGRYFIQAQAELEGSGIELMKQGESGVPTISKLLADKLNKGSVVGFYGPLYSVIEGRELKACMEENGISLKTNEDIVDSVWINRPPVSKQSIFSLEKYCGESTVSKLERVRKELQSAKADAHLVCSLSDIAWFTNLRGSDIAYNPLFMAYLYLDMTDCLLFVAKEAVNAKIGEYLHSSGIEIRDYDEFYSFLAGIRDRHILMDSVDCNYETMKVLEGANRIRLDISPLTMMKIIKNETEIRHTVEAHIRDGVYVTRFTKWLREEVSKGNVLTEWDAADYLDRLRLADEKSVSLSFDTIAGYAQNGAIVHYHVQKETAARLLPKGLFLYDSGGSYLDGTTDITRTTALGEVTQEQKLHYTLVTVGMLRLLNARFKKGANGTNLDTLARERLWQYGLDYNHGTGHGVGFCNTVHEGPNSIRFKPSVYADRNVELAPGMILSNEPGMYVEGSHGIRIENLVLVEEDEVPGFLRFRSLTVAPLDPKPMDVGVMTQEEVSMFNRYQKMVYDTLAPRLSEEEAKWLKNETAELVKQS